MLLEARAAKAGATLLVGALAVRGPWPEAVALMGAGSAPVLGRTVVPGVTGASLQFRMRYVYRAGGQPAQIHTIRHTYQAWGGL